MPKVFKSGNGLGIIIPSELVKENKLEAGHTIEITLRKRDIPIEPPKNNNFNKSI